MENDLFFDLLSERIVSNGFTCERLKDAVNSVIDGFGYKELNISDIIRYDRKIKLYTYAEVAELVTSGKASFNDFEIKNINGIDLRILKKDML